MGDRSPPRQQLVARAARRRRVASCFRWLDLDAFGDSDLRFAFAALVYHVVPAVLAGLACWWIDAREAGA